jgi:hypothetical protein
VISREESLHLRELLGPHHPMVVKQYRVSCRFGISESILGIEVINPRRFANSQAKLSAGDPDGHLLMHEYALCGRAEACFKGRNGVGKVRFRETATPPKVHESTIEVRMGMDLFAVHENLP